MDYDYWLFDLDGTLVHTDWTYTRELFDTLGRRLGRHFSDREVRILWHGLCPNRTAKLEEWGVDAEAFWRILTDIERPGIRATHTHLYKDAHSVASLPGPVGLVTHCRGPLTAAVLEQLDIEDWFDTVICCDDSTGWKPDPGPINQAIERLDVDSSATGIFVGDGAVDIDAAHNAGIDGLHVDRFPNREGISDQCRYRFSTLSPLPSRG